VAGSLNPGSFSSAPRMPTLGEDDLRSSTRSASFPGPPSFNAGRPGLEQGFNYRMVPTQTATSRLLLFAAARFCEVVGPNAIQRCRGVPDRIHLRA
jgi:hypothetical protein